MNQENQENQEDSTAGKELVRRNHVPLWDAMVENIIEEMVTTIKDEDMTQDVKGGVLHSKAKKLTKLVEELDSGTTKYGSLSPVVHDDTPESVTETRERPILQMTDDEVWERLQSMSAADKQAFINDVTTKGAR